MSGIKLNFNIEDLANANKMKVIDSFRLKDGSSIKVCAGDNAVDIYQVKNGRLLGAKGFRGKDNVDESDYYREYLRENFADDADRIYDYNA